ncbi:MAG: hypothetical protein EOP53_24605 [Sphingobacteriales bacterium]|nr:MAG: hypothetical protein EOP53_24605 [Sphingobacteriales bacterium]
MKNRSLSLIALLIIALGACKNKTTINQNEAGDVISRYLEGNPEYQTTRFKYGEIKFNSDSEREELKKYRELEREGLVTLTLIEQKKQFLSSDSSFTYQVKLTENAGKYVLKQGDNKATVKAVEYVVADEAPVNFEQVNSSTSKVTVTLKKKNTPFALFQDAKNENSATLTKTYKLKLHKEEGWKVVN